MRPPSFRSFLSRYCQELAGQRTTSIKRLARAAAEEAPRVAEPLFFYAASLGRTDLLLRESAGTWMHEDYALLARRLEADGLDRLCGDRDSLPRRYAKVLEAYDIDATETQRGRERLRLIRERTCALMAERNLTRRGVARELGLDSGNVSAYLAGDCSRVSEATGRRIYRFCKGCQDAGVQ